MIAIVDYGVGNVRAFANIYQRLGIAAMLAATEHELAAADRIILPGVGAFDWAMTRLRQAGLLNVLHHCAQGERKPILGICVGMQMMARRSDEGELPGLGWIDGEVKRFDATRFADATHLPHMGWNGVRVDGAAGLFRGFDAGARFYFLHSYYFAPARPADVLATTDYHGEFAAGVHSGNIYGVQFHPEKSHQWGIALLKNFAEL
jgi:imidazole glycerol-phosphate synthase subunit HisH